MKKLKTISLALIMTLLISVTSFAHPGRLDSKGGHYVRTAGWGYPVGSYHYHRKAPQAVKKKSTKSSSNTVKKVQTKLNSLGYNCGKADGIMGSKTKTAIKKFQKKNGLVADGIAGSKTLRKLGL